MEPVHVLLAGDRKYSKFLLEGRNKCLLEFQTGRLLGRTLHALENAQRVKTVLVVGPELLGELIPASLPSKPISLLIQKDSFSENLLAALEWIQHNHPGSPAVFVTNDAPLLTSEELDEFAQSVVQQPADINIAVFRTHPITLADPLVQQYIRSIVALSDGLFLLANQVSLSAASADLLEAGQKIFDLRKQSKYGTSLRTFYYLVREWGSGKNVISWLRLIIAKKVWLMVPKSSLNSWVGISLGEIEMRLGRAIGQKLRLRITEIPNAFGAFDADTPSQLKELRSVVEQQEARIMDVGVDESIKPWEANYAGVA
ncbi:MAG: nucleotidyltransferase family protein [Pyrinomonadaceae bacterium]